MKVLQRLTVENLQKNKRRTIVTIIGVMLASALMLAVAGMVTSFQQMMISYTKARTGDYHDMYEDVPAEDLKYIENNAQVESYFYSEPITQEGLDEEEYLAYHEAYLHLPYPQKYYERLDEISEQKAGEKGEKYNIFVRYKEPEKYSEIANNILDTIMTESGIDVNVRTNGDLLRYEAMVMADTALGTLYWLAAIVIAIIVVTSVFVIRNSFSISATERARQFGMLASIGATPRQIRHSVIFEGLVIAVIGIPLGIILGSLATVVLVGVVNYLLDGMIVEDSKVVFSMPLWIFLVTIALSLLTVVLASLMPAIRAARMSPIEAIRGNQDTKIKAKKLHSSKLVHRLFGIGGVIADKNIKRSRKKYRTTVISIVLSVATFVGLSSFMMYGQKSMAVQFQDAGFDFAIQNAPRELCDEVVERFGIKDYGYYWAAKVTTANVVFVDQETFEEFAKSLNIIAKDYNKVAIMDDYGLNRNDSGVYVMERDSNAKEGETYAVEVYREQKKDGTVDETTFSTVEIPITKITDNAPLGFDAPGMMGIYVAENYYLREQLQPQTQFTSLYAKDLEDVKGATEYTENLIETKPEYESAFVYNVEEMLSQQRRLYLLIAIFLYGFVIVVMLIGITNIFNTITTSIALRSKEFAMLKSVGMTSKEFNRMVRLESLIYSGKALLIGLPIGVLISYGFYRAIANSIDFGFMMPWSAIVIAILAVGALIWTIMTYSVRQVEKQNIIETIRDENI